MRKHERKNVCWFYGFRDVVYRVNILGMYDVVGNLLSGITSMYVNSLACFRVQGDE